MTKKLFTPGPMNIPQTIRVQLSKEIIHHRMPDFHKLFRQVRDKLKYVFKTEQDVLILTSSGTGAMESSVINLFNAGDWVLVINTGFFGERFIELCQTYGLRVVRLDYSWGNTYNLADVKRALQKYPTIKGIFVTYHETSTGVLNDIQSLGELIKETNTLLIVDAISGLIVHPFHFDGWHVDCALSSSQKGFGLPPGLAFVTLSQKALARIEQGTNLPKYYFDYRKYMAYAKKGESPFTPSITLIVGLNIALEDIIERGIETIVQEKNRLRQYTEEKFKQLGFELFITDPSIRGNVIVPVLSKKEWQLDLTDLTKYLDERYNLQVSKGQGKYSDQMLRVGLLSDFTEEDIDELVVRIEEYLLNLNNEVK